MSTLALSLKLSAIKTLSAVQRAINILKSAGPGAWYDPSDLTTLYQDSAGTTPVTAVEQPVGLILDKSKGLVLGSELVASQDLSTWTSGGAFGNWGASTATTDTVTTTATNGARYQRFPVTPGTSIKASAFVSRVGTATGVRISVVFGTSAAAYISEFPVSTASTTPAFVTATGAAPPNAAFCEIVIRVDGVAGSQGVFTSISVRELPGAHLIQPTATSRPTLSSRYNLLTKTEAFDDAAWPKINLTATPNATTAPDGTTTAEKIVETTTASVAHYIRQISTAVASGTAVTYSLYAKAGERTRFGMIDGYANKGAVFDLSNGTVVGNLFGGAPTSSTITSVGNGWYLCTITVTTSGANTDLELYPVQTGTTYIYTGDGTSGIYIWGASLTTAADAALPYQRVNTATDYDYDFSKFPAYLKFDGVDDSMYTAASIDFTSTDKMTVFAGVHKASDAAVGVPLEFSSSIPANNGSFGLLAPASAASNVQFASRGTATDSATKSSHPAPVSAVYTGIGNISGDLVKLRINGVDAASGNFDQGTGNFGNYPLYVGRRNNATLPFNGRIYQLAIKGKALSAAEISTVEALINSRTKAF